MFVLGLFVSCLRPSVFELRADRTRRYLRGPELVEALTPGPKPASLQFGPCGRCEFCIASAASRWSSRGRHEAAQWDYTYLLTLTFRDDAYPAGQADLERRVVLFVKSLREGRAGETVRTMGCTELGDHTRRPHAHLAVFCDRAFELGKPVGTGARGDPVHECDEVARYWPHGMVGVSGGPSAGLTTGLVAYVTGHQSEPGLGCMMVCEHERDAKLRPVARSVFLKSGTGGGDWLPVVDGWLHHSSGELFIARAAGRRGAWRVCGRPFERSRREGSTLATSPDDRLRVRVHWHEETRHPLSGAAVYFRPSASVCRSRGLGYEWADRFGLSACEAGALIDRGGVRLPLPGSVRRRVTRDMSDAEREALGSQARAAAEARARALGSTPGGWDTTPERRAVQLEVFRARKASVSAGRGLV